MPIELTPVVGLVAVLAYRTFRRHQAQKPPRNEIAKALPRILQKADPYEPVFLNGRAERARNLFR